MDNRLILIVGAGPTGMTAAIELKRAGFDVRIVDKSEHMAQHSQALVVQARTLEQWQRYGIADEAVKRGRRLLGARFYSDGKQIVSLSLDQIQSKYPYVLFLPQQETEALLNEKMESLGVKTERQVELDLLTQEGDKVRAILKHADGKLEEVNPRWMLGCDGAHSTVRDKTGTKFEGAGVGLFFFLGDMELQGEDAPEEWLSIHVKEGDVVFMGRLDDKWVRLIVALHEKQNESEDRELNLEDFQKAVDKVGVRVKVISSDWMTPFRVNDRQAEHYRIGNVFLAGDASHIHSPVGGQGMNTGIQDVANLAWKLAAVARGAEDRLLDTYQQERGEVGYALLEATERGLKMATLQNSALVELRDALVPFLSHRSEVQKTLAGFISETSIEYRNSSIVRDEGGDGNLKAGDRMQDLPLKEREEGSTLLRDWNGEKHLAVVLNGTEDEVAEFKVGLLHADVAEVHTHELDEEARRLVGIEKKVFIVRPDGYVGYRGPIERGTEWREYARQDALEPIS